MPHDDHATASTPTRVSLVAITDSQEIARSRTTFAKECGYDLQSSRTTNVLKGDRTSAVRWICDAGASAASKNVVMKRGGELMSPSSSWRVCLMSKRGGNQHTSTHSAPTSNALIPSPIAPRTPSTSNRNKKLKFSSRNWHKADVTSGLRGGVPVRYLCHNLQAHCKA